MITSFLRGPHGGDVRNAAAAPSSLNLVRFGLRVCECHPSYIARFGHHMLGSTWERLLCVLVGVADYLLSAATGVSAMGDKLSYVWLVWLVAPSIVSPPSPVSLLVFTPPPPPPPLPLPQLSTAASAVVCMDPFPHTQRFAVEHAGAPVTRLGTPLGRRETVPCSVLWSDEARGAHAVATKRLAFRCHSLGGRRA